jgi:hypothetical protein
MKTSCYTAGGAHKGLHIGCNLFFCEVIKGGVAAGMGGKTGKVKRQITVFVARRITENGMTQKGIGGAFDAIIDVYYTHLMPLLVEFTGDVKGIDAASRALQGKMVNQ